VLLGAAKANIGHSEAASGLVGLVKAVCQLRRGKVPPLAHFTRLNPEIRTKKGDGVELVIPTTTVEIPVASRDGEGWGRKKMLAGVSAFGISGTNG
jgi:acyl transferase domain-containing protein